MTLAQIIAQIIAQFYRPTQPSFAAVIAPIQDALTAASRAENGDAIAPLVASMFEAKYGATPEQAREVATVFAETYVDLSWHLLPYFIGEYTFEAAAEILDYQNQVISMAQAAAEWGKKDWKNSPVRKWQSGKLKFTTRKAMIDQYGPPQKKRY